jgi:hypothetical protein
MVYGYNLNDLCALYFSFLKIKIFAFCVLTLSFHRSQYCSKFSKAYWRPPSASDIIVDSYTYLGVVFNYNGNYCTAKKRLIDQANKALYALYYKLRNLTIPPEFAHMYSLIYLVSKDMVHRIQPL